MVIIAFLGVSVLFLANSLTYTLFKMSILVVSLSMFDDAWIQERFPSRKGIVLFVSVIPGAIMHLPPNPPQPCYLKLCIGFAWQGSGSRWEDTRSFPHFRLSGTSFLNYVIISKPSISKTSGNKPGKHRAATHWQAAGLAVSGGLGHHTLTKKL